jgi:hypothetical protein
MSLHYAMFIFYNQFIMFKSAQSAQSAIVLKGSENSYFSIYTLEGIF